MLERLDRLFATGDHDSPTWCDGGLSDLADRYLSELDETEWLQLKLLWRDRNAQWQGCLITVLKPSYGVVSQDIIVSLAYSEDPEIAFLAMRCISFYCGVNLNRHGEFFDESIVDLEFSLKLKNDAQFLESISSIGAFLGKDYGLLKQVLTVPT